MCFNIYIYFLFFLQLLIDGDAKAVHADNLSLYERESFFYVPEYACRHTSCFFIGMYGSI